MKHRLALLLLLPFLLDADKPWPQKGDTVYLAAELHEHTPALPLMGGEPDVNLAACVPLRCMGEHIFGLGFRDDRGSIHSLKGDWTAYLYRESEPCKAAVQKNGLPRVEAKGRQHRLVDSH